MGSWRQRELVGEMMDEPGVDPAELERALAYIRLVNRVAGGTSGLIRTLQRWSSRWERGKVITLLDVGTGSADIPIAARAWAMRRGFDLRITALDLHEKTLDAARRAVAGMEGIRIVAGDALHLDAQFGEGSFDYAHAGMFLHHLPTPAATHVLRQMASCARRGVVWNDLVRARWAYAAVWCATIGQKRMVRHDATVSIRAGFTRQEAEMMAAQAGAAFLRWRRSPWMYRFIMAGEKA